MNMNTRAKKYFRSQRRKRDARIAKTLKAVAAMIAVAGFLIIVGAAGSIECFTPIAVAMKNFFSGALLLIEGGTLAGAAWIVEALS